MYVQFTIRCGCGNKVLSLADAQKEFDIEKGSTASGTRHVLWVTHFSRTAIFDFIQSKICTKHIGNRNTDM